MKFIVKRVPKSINAVGQHWGWRHSEKNKWVELFAEPKAKAENFAFYAKQKRRVGISIHWGKPGPLPDQDNLIAGMKPVIDALKAMGFIYDDGPKWADIVYCATVRDSKSWTEFVIE